MTEPLHKDALIIAVIFIAIFLIRVKVFSHPAPYCAENFGSNAISTSIKNNETADNFKKLTFVSPKDIFAGTDQNECTAEISKGLNVQVISGKLIRLTWEMTGATRAVSKSSGINQIGRSVFNPGTTLVTYTLTDNRNDIQTCSFTVTVTDNRPPQMITYPGNKKVFNIPGECYAKVFWPEPVVTDNCVSDDKIVISSNYHPGDKFPVGTTNVVYTISDGTNEFTYTFSVTVVDAEPPVLVAPEAKEVVCGNPVEDAFTRWEQFEKAGGKAFDNCGIDYSSFRYKRQVSSGIHCPYTVTRTYSIADINGNVTEVDRIIYVTGDEPVVTKKPVAAEKQNSKSVLKSGAGTSSVTISLVSLTDVSCFGGSDGAIDLNITTNNGPITSIVWDHGPTTEDISRLSAGTYTIRVTDGDGTEVQNFIINQPNQLAATLAKNDITCNGATDGEITVSSPSGGSGTYEVSINGTNWFGVSMASPYTFNNLSAGNYNIQIRDAANTSCVVNLGSRNITEPAVLSAAVSSTDVTCNGANDGTITVSSPTGGYGTWETSINGTNWYPVSGASPYTFNNLAPGSYTVQIRDAANISCIINLGNQNITEPAVPVVNAPSNQTVCAGETTTAVTFTGTATSYNWTNDNTSIGLAASGSGNIASFTATNPGNTVLVANIQVTPVLNNGGTLCYGTPETFTITVNPTPTVVSTPSSETICSGASTNISLSGTVSGTTFSWTVSQSGVTGASSGNGNSIVQTLSTTGSAPGTVTYTITPSANGCSGTPVNVLITVNPIPDVIATPGSETICSGTSTNISLAGTVSGTTFSWTVAQSGVSGATNGSGNSISQTLTSTGSSSGTATYTVTPSANGCTGTPVNIVITVNSPLIPPVISADQNICYNTAPQSLVGTAATGGTSPYGYQWQQSPNGTGSWSNIPGANSTVFSPSALTNTTFYRLQVTDNGNPSCGTDYSNVIAVNVAPELSASASATSILCKGGSATVTLNASGGTPPYNYTFNGVADADGIIQNVTAGTYNWSVSDALSCGPVTGTISISEPPLLTATISITDAIDCYGETGEVTINATGGTAPYTYTFNGVTQSNNVFTGVLPGNNLTWSVEDANGCKYISGTPVNMTSPTQLSASATPTHILCNGDNSGSIDLVVTGGTLPYTFLWNNGFTGEDPSGLAAGNYTVTITDANGCSVSTSATINQPQALSASVSATTISCYGQTADIRINAGGGTPPYTYTFNGITNGTGLFPALPAANNIPWQVQDANGCIVSSTFDLVQPSEIIINSISAVDNSVCEGENISLLSSATGGTGSLRYNWTGPNGYSANNSANPTIINSTLNHSGTYTLTVSDANNCSKNSSIDIVVNPTPTANTISNIVECAGATVNEIVLTGTGADAFDWTIDIDSIWTNAQSGTGNIPAFTTINGGNAPVTATVTVTPRLAGEGCSGVPGTFTITVNPIPNATAIPDEATFCEDPTTNILLSSNVSGATFDWTAQLLSGTASGFGPGSGNAIIQTINSSGGRIEYTITPTANGCIGSPVSLAYSVVEVVDRDYDQSLNVTGTADDITVCPGDIVNYNLQAFNGWNYAVRFTWETDNPNIGLAATGGPLGSGWNIFQRINASVTFTAVNNTDVPQTANILFTSHAYRRNGNHAYRCEIISVSRKITVDPFLAECPADTVVNASAGTCTATIATENPAFSCAPNLVTWTMSGATTASSPSSGINYVGNYTFNIGTTTITYYAEDGNGNSSTCSFDVTVNDAEAPSISGCPSDIVQAMSSTACGEIITFSDPVFTDNCDGIVIAVRTDGTGLNSGDLFPVGTTTITWYAEDTAGNDTTCSFNVTVLPDATGPAITCVPDRTGCAPFGGTFLNTGNGWDATAIDNCPGIIGLNYTLSGATSGTGTSLNNVQFNVGTTTVEWTATDINSNTSTCSFDVVITEAPGFLMEPTDIATCLNGSATFTVSTGGTPKPTCQWRFNGTNIAGATDTFLVINNAQASDAGLYDVVITNSCGSATSATAELTVSTPPSIAVQPASQTDCLGESVEFTVTATGGESPYSYYWEMRPSAADSWVNAQTVNNISVNNDIILVSNIGDSNNPDQAQYRVIVTDACGNKDTSSIATLTVNQVLTPAVIDSVTVCQDGGASFSVLTSGSNPVSYRWQLEGANISDDAVFSGTSTQTLTINNAQVSERGTYSAQVTFNITQPNNNGAGVTTCQSSFVDIGELIVDEGPRIVASMTSQTICPGEAITQIDLSNANGTPGTTYTWTRNNTAVLTGMPASGSGSSITGTLNSLTPGTMVTTTFTISAIANGCVSDTTVTIIVGDTIAPVSAGCPSDLTVNTDPGSCNAVVNYIIPTFDDNCQGTGLPGTLVEGPASGAQFPIGTTTVKYIYTDAAGNVSDTCAFNVTVEDREAPTALCHDLTVYLDAAGTAQITPGDIDNGSFDGCALDSIRIDISTFTCSEIGANTVTLTVVDLVGNEASCPAVVTVADTVKPTVICKNIDVYLDTNGQANISAADVDNGSYDNCGISTMNLSVSNFTCSEIGANQVTLTVTDNYGNSNSCNAIVTVHDTISPVAVCKDIVIPLNAGGKAGITASDIDNGSSDNCGIAGMSVSIDSFDCSNVGTNQVILTVNDASGNSSTCTATVTVEDIEKPVAKCKDITIQLDANGLAAILPADVDNGSSDNCGVLALSISPDSFDCTNLGTNIVVLTATDSYGNDSTCQATVTVADDLNPVDINATVSQQPILCYGDLTDVTISVAGGIAPLTYTFNGVSQSGNTFNNIAAGTYTWSVTDAFGCGDTTGTFEVIEPEELHATINATDVTCSSGHDGVITITNPGGGAGNYEFSNDGGSTWQTNPVFSGLAPGVYNIQMRDANGCQKILNPNLEVIILAADITSSDVSCYGSNDGSITLSNPNGGSGSYNYTIDGGLTWVGSGAGGYTFTNLAADTFDVRIRDENDPSCVIPLNTAFIIHQPDILTAAVDSANITCFGASDGTITISSQNGGTGLFEYTINGGINWLSTDNFTNLAPGTYDVRIRDANSCETILNSALVLTEPAVLNAQIDSTNISCNGYNDGEIVLSNPTGGFGTYEFSIDGGTTWQANNTFKNLYAGSYDVMIRDAANPACNIVLNPALILSEPAQLAVVSQPSGQTDCLGATVSFQADITGGAGTIVYEWQRMKPSESVFTAIGSEPNVSGQDTRLLQVLNAGNADSPNGTQYRLVISDNCMLLTSDTVTLTVNEITAVDPNISDTELCEGQNYSLQVTTSGTVPTAYQWQIDSTGTWENLANSSIISGANSNRLTITGATPAESGSYRVVVTFSSSGSGCNISSESFVRNLTVNELPVVNSTADLVVCNNETVSQINFTGTASSYQWTNDNPGIGLAAGGTGNILSFTAQNTDTIPVSATIIVTPKSLYCDGIPDTFNITVNPTPVAVKPVGVVFCEGFPTVPYPLTGIPDNALFDITGGSAIGLADATDVTEIPSFIPGAGTANVTIIPKLNGCTGTPVSFNILVVEKPVVTMTGGDTICQGATATNIVFVNQVSSSVEAIYTINNTDTNKVVLGAFSPAQVPVPTNVPGDFTYKLISVKYITSPFCSNPDVRDSVKIVVVEPPIPTIIGPAVVCEKSGGNVYTTESGMNNYVWNVSAGATITAGGNSTSDTITVTWNTPGNKNVSVRYTDNNACSAVLPTIFPVTVNQNPTPTITGSGNVCEDAVKTYNTQSGMYSYSWDVNGGVITAGGGSSDNTVTVAWDTAGIQTVSVNYINANGCTADSATLALTLRQITVHPEPSPSIAGVDTACTGNTYVYTSDPGMTNYVWTVSAGGNIVSGGGYNDNTATVRWNVAGNQSISVNYTDSNGCTASADSTMIVTVYQSPEPVINGPAIICAGSTNATYRTEPGMTNYLWTVSSGGTITGGANDSIVYVTWNSTGNHTISVDYTNENNCSANTPTVLNVVAVAEVVPTVTGIQTVCEGTTGNYTTESGMLNYNWSVVGGSIVSGGGPTDKSVTILWDSTGVQTVSVNYTNLDGCNSITTDHPVTVDPMPHPTINGETSACLDNIVYTYTTEPGMTAYQWIYSTGAVVVGGGSSTDNYIDIMWTVLGPQSVSVNYTNASGCRATSAKTSNIIVNALTPVSCPNDTAICINAGLITLSGGNPSGGVFSGPGVSGGVFDPAAANLGIHTITYSYTNDSSCVSTCTFDIRVDPQPNVNDTFITICSEYALDINLNDIVPGATFSWVAADNSGGGASVTGFNSCSSGCDTVISDILVNSSITEPVYSTGNAGTVIYQVTASRNGCSGTFNIVVTVEPSIIELNHSWNSNFVEPFIEVCAGAEALSSNDLEILHPTRTSGYFNSYGLLINGNYFNGGWNPTILYGPSEEGPWINAPGSWNNPEGPYQWLVDFSVNDRLGYHYFVVQITDPNTGCIKISKPAILNIVSSLDLEAGGPDFLCSSSAPTPHKLDGAYVGGLTSNPPARGSWSIKSLNPSNGGNNGSLSSTSATTTPGNITYTPPADYIGQVTLTLTSSDPDGSGQCVPLKDERTLTILPPTSFTGCIEPSTWYYNGEGAFDENQAPCAVTLVGSNDGSGAFGAAAISHCSGAGTLSFDWHFKAPLNQIVWHQEDQQQGYRSGNNMVVNAPTNLSAGDLIIVTIHVNAGTNVNNPPAGFSAVSANINTTNSNVTLATFYKIADGTESTLTFGTTGSVSSDDRIYASRVTGHNPSNPIGNSRGITVTTPVPLRDYVNVTIPSVNTTLSNSMLVSVLAINVSGTNSEDVEYINSPLGSKTMYYEDYETTARLAQEIVASAGATGSRSFSWPSYNSRNRRTTYSAAQLFVINPATPDVDAAYYSIDGTPVLLSNTNGESGTVSVPIGSGSELGFVVTTDKNTGGPGELTIFNLTVPNDPPAVSGDTLKVYTQCMSAGFDPDTAFVPPTVVDDCGTDSLQTGFPVTSAIFTNGCENWQTRTWLYVDDCGQESDTFTQRVVWTVVDTLILTCPASDTLPACVDAATIQTAYDAWKAGFYYTGGCSMVFDNLNEFPVLIDLSCGGQLEFTLVVSDGCGQLDSCTSYFVIQAAQDLVLTCPNDTLLPACSDTADIRLAYEAWKSQFSYSGGCSTVTTNIDSIPDLTDLSCGGQIEFRYVVNLGSPSCPNSVDCIRTFGVDVPEDLEVIVPPDATLPLCSDTASIRAAYNTWVSTFATTGGCDVITNIDSIPALPDLTCGGSVSFVFRAENGPGKCIDMAVDSSTFSVIAPPPLTMTCPPDPNLPGCSGIIAITNAYNDWVDGFNVLGGCDVTTNIDSIPPLGDLLCDGQLTFTFIATNGGDVCFDTNSCTSTFTIGAADSLIVFCPGDTIVEGCSAAEVQPLFDSWIAQFGYTGGCNATETDLSIYVPPATCGGSVVINYIVIDECGQTDSCVATFRVEAPELTITVPNDTLLSACSSQAEIDLAFANWISKFGYYGGCNVLATDTSQFNPPDICGGDVVVNYSATDACGQVKNASAFFAIDIPKNVDLNPSFTVPADATVYSDAVCNYDADPVITGWPTNLSDNCTEDSLSVSYADSIVSGACIGAYIIYRSWTVIDNCGNYTTQVQLINVLDSIPPVITCPADTSEYADPNFCYKTGMNPGMATATDNCTPAASIVITNDAPAQLPVGTTVVTWTATDDCGNTSTCTQNITIIDVTPPEIEISGCQDVIDSAAWNNCSKIPDNMNDPIYHDDCWPVDSLTLTYTITGVTTGSGTGSVVGLSFNVGVSTVVYTVTDPDGNQASCSFTVTILDTTPPGIGIAGCQDVSDTAGPGNCWKIPGSIQDPTYSDNCWPVDSLTLTYHITGATTGSGTGSVVGLSFNVGVSTVTYIVADPDGNMDSCSFTVNIIDTVPPTLQISGCQDVTENAAPSNCRKIPDTLTDPVYSDNCWPNDSLTLDFVITGALDTTGVGTVTNISFPVGVSLVTYTVTDPNGNYDQCSFYVTIVDVTPPYIAISNCQDITGTMDATSCFAVPPGIVDPLYSDNCWPVDSLELSFVITGAWDTTGVGYVSGLAFPIGISTVTYTVTDPDGNTADCSFTVEMLRDAIPSTAINCPSGMISTTVLPGECSAYIDLDPPTINESCAWATYTITNNITGTDNADTLYPIGITQVIWTITDNSGNDTTCVVDVEVIDLPPTLVCPPDTVLQADFEKDYASNVVVGIPTFDDNCPDSTLTYVVTAPSGATIIGNSDPSGINMVTGPNTYEIGTTEIAYTFTDAHGHVVTCSHFVTVLGAPVIECPPDTTVYADATGCTNTFDPGTATLLEGSPPITWTYTITFPDGTIQTDTYVKNAPNQDADPLGDIVFPLGTTTIVWRAENVSGYDECSHQVVVLDTIPPTFTADPYQNCVDMLHSATYDPANPNPVVNHVDPNLVKFPVDFRTLPAGDTSLDLTSLEDNCCDSLSMVNNIHWRIDFSPIPDPFIAGAFISPASVSGTGQPSMYGSDIYLWGDGVYYSTITHYIYYWVEDCNGNQSEEIVREITITPRPEIIKLN